MRTYDFMVVRMVVVEDSINIIDVNQDEYERVTRCNRGAESKSKDWVKSEVKVELIS